MDSLWTHPGDEGQRYASLLWYRDPEHLRARQHDIGGGRSNCGKSAGGASLATALHAVDANGAVVAFGNSSGEMTSISFADFRRGQNARLQSFFSFTSGPEEQFAPDLALLVSLVADKSLDAADRAGAELARHCAGCRRAARPACRREGGVSGGAVRAAPTRLQTFITD